MRKPIASVLLAATMATFLVGPVGAETVRLKNGNIITGEVVADKAEFVAVDLGYGILEIPRDQVAAIEEETAEDAQPAAEAEDGKLYMTAKLKRRTVKELVAAFGEGLVKVQTPKGVGSGFFINKQGHVITNAHVIEGETEISAILFVKEGETFKRRKVKDVEIVAVNPSADLALLKVKKPDDIELTLLYFGEMSRVKTGEPVFAIGNPFGFERSVSEGIVSHKARHAEKMLLIQTTAPINPGNSGGPLLNMRGEVIGVTNMKLGLFAEGMGFAVPINYVKDFLRFHEAYAYDKDNPNAGYRYLEPPHRGEEGATDDEEPEERETPEQD
ncbi:MAG: S1C family serine protease [Planctomycetota bacterium]|jgi:serine protease Do